MYPSPEGDEKRDPGRNDEYKSSSDDITFASSQSDEDIGGELGKSSPSLKFASDSSYEENFHLDDPREKSSIEFSEKDNYEIIFASSESEDDRGMDKPVKSNDGTFIGESSSVNPPIIVGVSDVEEIGDHISRRPLENLECSQKEDEINAPLPLDKLKLLCSKYCNKNCTDFISKMSISSVTGIESEFKLRKIDFKRKLLAHLTVQSKIGASGFQYVIFYFGQLFCPPAFSFLTKTSSYLIKKVLKDHQSGVLREGVDKTFIFLSKSNSQNHIFPPNINLNFKNAFIQAKST